MTDKKSGKGRSASKGQQSELPTPLIKHEIAATEVPLADLGPITEIVAAIATLTQAPVALALQAVLASISASAQGLADVETLGGPSPISLYLLSIAESGSRKSAVDRLATRAIREWEEPRMRDYLAVLNRFHQAEASGAKRSGKNLVIEDETHEEPGVPLTEPENPKLMFEDITFEGVARHFENGRSSIAIYSDEGGKILDGYAMSSQNQVAFCTALSHAWDGKAITRVRATTGSTYLPGRRIALHLAVQDLIAQRFLGNAEIRDQGLINRMLIVRPDSLKGTRLIRNDPETLARNAAAREVLKLFDASIADLLAQDIKYRDKTSGELELRLLTLGPESKRQLVDFYNLVECEKIGDGYFANISGFADKAPEQAARLAGNLAFFTDPEATSIAPAIMSVAITLMNFYLDEAVRILDTGNIPKRLLDAELLKDWLCNRWKEDLIDVRAIMRFGPNSLRSSSQVRELVKLLEENGWLKRLDGSHYVKNHKSKSAYRIVRP
ncbi:YfjI family protein [Sulfitobacter sp. D35]|uniref:YfjI family protein n=1 Tax=Sulfitobacter sp. D35 TaxID=3083252 RepID=UPI00296E6C23|nr:YfjI family protein [Sulfitobacter sp. D35]MDW4500574.1 YfjI family protein [Sulfitobacter sp. D35]